MDIEQAKIKCDENYADVRFSVIATQSASITRIQRKFRLSYGHAVRIVEELEKEGVVSAPDESGRRAVLKTTIDNVPRGNPPTKEQ